VQVTRQGAWATCSGGYRMCMAACAAVFLMSVCPDFPAVADVLCTFKGTGGHTVALVARLGMYCLGQPTCGKTSLAVRMAEELTAK